MEINKRKVRYYIQKGLVDRPEGSGKNAFYAHRHVEQLLAIRKWKDAGLLLERIQELLGREPQEEDASDRLVPPPRPKKPGSVEVWSHLYIADGVELPIGTPAVFPAEGWPFSRRNAGRFRPEYATRRSNVALGW